ncbi:MAG: amidohydrolase family protein [Gemmatimonadota bacterium]|nr:amidohydrolase family protein [Gemmatimonadota bacterium]
MRMGILLSLTTVAAACSDPDDRPGIGTSRATADHHLHLSSEGAAVHLDSAMVALGEGEEDAPPSRGRTAAEAIAALDSAGVDLGFVFSNAYMFGMPEAPTDDEAERVRSENEYVLSEAARYPTRLVPFCSLNPLRSYALDEVARCGDDLRAGGLKLHLANSDVNLGDSAHVAALRTVFARADRVGLPLVVHLRTRAPAYGAREADIFIDSVLSATARVPVQVAHMAGWGGYDENTDEALGAFARAIGDGRIEADRITFGLGAVVFDPEAAAGDTAMAATVREANARLAGRIREIGVDRVVYATDWPSWPPVPEPVLGIRLNRELIRRALPLDPDELDRLFNNVGAAFDWMR